MLAQFALVVVGTGGRGGRGREREGEREGGRERLVGCKGWTSGRWADR